MIGSQLQFAVVLGERAEGLFDSILTQLFFPAKVRQCTLLVRQALISLHGFIDR